MSRYLLDTNACIAWLKNHPQVVARITAAGEGGIALCGTVKSELWWGACKSQRVLENQAKLREFFTALPTLPFDDAVAEHYGSIRFELERVGQPIGPFDTQIAAFARAHGCTLVTHNLREFLRVPDLQVEDWHAGF
jgi:tRNA(fMet)-specific endonuclease VapC